MHNAPGDSDCVEEQYSAEIVATSAKTPQEKASATLEEHFADLWSRFLGLLSSETITGIFF